jgi:phosphatidylserine/phosphatidylglycerophosphate/cardiolipin synthase-like enzyme
MSKKAANTPKAIDQTIRKNLPKLRKPGVLTVRPGYEIANHQLTGKPAIVATVHTKKAVLPKADMLPDKIGSIPVDVREATAHQRLRAHDPAAAALTQAYGRPEDKEPVWPLEREISTGRLLNAKNSATQRAVGRSKDYQKATNRALDARAHKDKINYVPAPNASLASVTTTTTITAHVSPDAGLETLKTFLDGTQESLVVGMYDFTSGPILETFLKDLSGTKTLQMVLDNPPLNKTANQSDDQTVKELEDQLGKRAKIARALAGDDVHASAYMFPSSYHIKVVVRDGNAFWLSSGNLNNSNQPDLASPPHTEDRDWHLIVEDAALANTFWQFLNQDFVSASEYQIETPDDAMAVRTANTKLAAEANPPPLNAPIISRADRVPAKVFKKINVKITPLLTPDTMPDDQSKGQYLTNIIALISGAQKKLYIQMQYIEASKGSGNYDTLVRAIAERIQAGVDVRLIESAQYGEKWAEKMKDPGGVDLTANIRLQPDVHNKGFVVDSQIVVVSSQNFSPDGVEKNRDAGLIIESAEIANYFEPIFLSDWNKLKPFAPKAAASPSRTRSQKSKKNARQAAPATAKLKQRNPTTERP